MYDNVHATANPAASTSGRLKGKYYEIRCKRNLSTWMLGGEPHNLWGSNEGVERNGNGDGNRGCGDVSGDFWFPVAHQRSDRDTRRKATKKRPRVANLWKIRGRPQQRRSRRWEQRWMIRCSWLFEYHGFSSWIVFTQSVAFLYEFFMT